MEITTIVWIVAAIVVALLLGQYFLSSKKGGKKGKLGKFGQGASSKPEASPENFSEKEEEKEISE